MARFRDDPAQRARWLNASSNRIEKSFRPGQTREAGGFRPSEYKQHCTWGGHPNPSARWLLPDHSGFPASPSMLVVDLAQHLTETMGLLGDVAEAAMLPSQGDLPETRRLWREIDPWSGRL